MNNQIVTISREYGSGGTLIGPFVAKNFGIPCYDRNALDRLARERGWEQLYISEWREAVSSLSLWGADSQTAKSWGMSPYYFNEKTMFLVQSRLIRELAEAGPCVFIGRCADYVLKDWRRCLRVWICADEDSRALRLYDEYFVRLGNLSEKIQTVDQGRREYYKRCTGQSWGDGRNYHMRLDSGNLGVEDCATAILSAAKTL